MDLQPVPIHAPRPSGWAHHIEPAVPRPLDPVNGLRSRPWILCQAESSMQAYAELLDNIGRTLDGSKPHSIAITSAPHDNSKHGASILLAHAAASLRHWNTLLIDADFVSRQIARQLGIQSTLGLSDVLGAGAFPGDAIIQSDGIGFDVLPAGQMGLAASKMLVSRRMQVLLDNLKKTYGLIIVNAGSLRNGSTAKALKGFDAVYLTVQMGHSPRETMKEAICTAQHAGVDLMGCILTHDGSCEEKGIVSSSEPDESISYDLDISESPSGPEDCPAIQVFDPVFGPPSQHDQPEPEWPGLVLDFDAEPALALSNAPPAVLEWSPAPSVQSDPLSSDFASDSFGDDASNHDLGELLLPAEDMDAATVTDAAILERLESIDPFELRPLAPESLAADFPSPTFEEHSTICAQGPDASMGNLDGSTLLTVAPSLHDESRPQPRFEFQRVARTGSQRAQPSSHSLRRRADDQDPWAANVLAICGALLCLASLIYVAGDLILWF